MIQDKVDIETIDKEILDRLQRDIPVSYDPFERVATELGVPFTELQSRLTKLFTQGFISHLGPIYDTKRTGYRTTLVAMECVDDQLELCGSIVGSYPGVSHCYERKSHFNLWSTLAVPPSSSLATVAKKMKLMSHGNIKKTIFLPELKRYKLRVNFKLGNGDSTQVKASGIRLKSTARFTDNDIKMLRILQDGLPCTEAPFETLALSCEFSASEIFGAMKEHIEKGFIRRVACLVRHRKAGYSANGMAVWNVSPVNSDRVGSILSQSSSVSHCYRRRTHPLWPYSHYAMIHGKSVKEVTELADSISDNAGISKSFVLFSLKEFKKCRLKLYTDEYTRWPEGIV